MGPKLYSETLIQFSQTSPQIAENGSGGAGDEVGEDGGVVGGSCFGIRVWEEFGHFWGALLGNNGRMRWGQFLGCNGLIENFPYKTLNLKPDSHSGENAHPKYWHPFSIVEYFFSMAFFVLAKVMSCGTIRVRLLIPCAVKRSF